MSLEELKTAQGLHASTVGQSNHPEYVYAPDGLPGVSLQVPEGVDGAAIARMAAPLQGVTGRTSAVASVPFSKAPMVGKVERLGTGLHRLNRRLDKVAATLGVHEAKSDNTCKKASYGLDGRLLDANEALDEAFRLLERIEAIVGVEIHLDADSLASGPIGRGC